MRFAIGCPLQRCSRCLQSSLFRRHFAVPARKPSITSRSRRFPTRTRKAFFGFPRLAAPKKDDSVVQRVEKDEEEGHLED